MSILDLDDFDDEDFEDSSVEEHSDDGSWRSNKNSEQQLSARSEEPQLSHHQREEENPHELEDLDPMMFGGIETHQDNVGNENQSFEEAQNNSSKDGPLIVDLQDFELSDEEQSFSDGQLNPLDSSHENVQNKPTQPKSLMEDKGKDSHESSLQDIEDFDEFSGDEHNEEEVTVLQASLPSSENSLIHHQPQNETTSNFPNETHNISKEHQLDDVQKQLAGRAFFNDVRNVEQICQFSDSESKPKENKDFPQSSSKQQPKEEDLLPKALNKTSKASPEAIFIPHKHEDHKVTEMEILKRKTCAPIPSIKKAEISDPFVKIKTAFESPEEELWNNNVFRKYGVESTMTETLSKKTSRQNIDLRDESLLHLVLGLFYTNGFSQACDKNRFQSSFKKRVPRATDKIDMTTNTTTSVPNPNTSKISSKSRSIRDQPSLFSQHFKDEGSLAQVLELYLLDFLEKNNRALRSNLIFILMSELATILNTISLYYYSTLSQGGSNMNIPSFSYRGPELSSTLFETFMSCFPFTKLSTNKYTLEHWISLSHINEIIYTLSRVIKSRFWNFDFRPNCDLGHLKLDVNLSVFDAHLPQPSSNSHILEIPLNELMYLHQQNAKQQEEAPTTPTTQESLEERLKNSILFERGSNGVDKNLFAKYQPALVQTCLDEVLNEIFADKFIIDTIRQRVADKIDQL
ncbi:hypothetical protein C9374_005121 [Naegleria lovaniensis]|uniref:Uncharacterized protein n=1 Tax=Naegleria lovaniensis TaxID=51637 RepID=A0AA88GNU0_NAELO|nr:uncharacterized protein C9374_005121 [Naegleria lovaniensis]KAG2382541.1 hypothetical protein C9374_005121 [Naegleria lovaniensis]